MESTVKNLSDTKVEISITVTTEELAIAEQIATTKLAKDIKAPGFRKGKTPLTIAVKHIDPNILQEHTIDSAISKAVIDAFQNNKLQLLDRPAVSIKKYVPSEILEFTAEVEILPTVKLGDYKKLKILKEKLSVSEDEVSDTIERIRQGLANKKEVSRVAKINDEVIIDYVGKKDNVAFDGGTGSDYALKLGIKQFIPGFEEGIVGHKSGDVFDLDLTFPADYHVADLKAAKVVFKVTLKSVKEIKLPEIDDKLAAKAGPFKTIDELKTDIRRELLLRKEQETKEKSKDDLVKQLVEISKIPVPEVLVTDQCKSIEQDFVNNLSYRGVTLDQYLENNKFESKEKWVEIEVKDLAIKRVKSGLVLAEISKLEKIEASEEEFNKHITLYKQQYLNNTEALKQFELPEVKRDIANRLLTEKTIDRLFELNTK